jgi:predicted transposase/invertase (TIGR01784 family)
MSDLAVAQSFFEAHLPIKFKKSIDWKTLQLCPGTFVDKQLQERYTDILYKVQLNKETGYLYVLVEHQSNPDELMAFRLLEYQVKIWRQYLKQTKGPCKKLPLILPMIYYSGKHKPYSYSTDLMDCFLNPKVARENLFKPYHLIDLTQISDDELKKHSLVAGLELIQKHIRDRDLSALMQKMLQEGLLVRIINHAGDYYEVLLNYVAAHSDLKEYEAFFDETEKLILEPERRKKMMTLAKRLEKKGRLEGKQEGKQERNLEIAKNMFKLGRPMTEISKVTGLKESELKQVEKSILKKKAA